MIANSESFPATPPTDRDLEIYAAVKVECRRQVDVAEQFGISQSRVSQICRDVVEWRSGMGFTGELEDRDRRQVEAWLDGQRLESLYAQTLEHYRRSCQPRRRERKGTNQHGDWQSESIDHAPGNLQSLRLASRLMEQRWKMHEKCPQPRPHALAHCDEATFINRLISMRHWAEVRGEVPRGEAPGRLVRRLLGEMLGWKEQFPSADCPGSVPGPPEIAEAADEPAAHTAHNMSAESAPYEQAAEADSGDGSGGRETTCEAADLKEIAAEERKGPEEKGANMSAGTGRQASRGARTATKVRSDAEEERLALAELQRTFATELTSALADHMVPNLLAQGQSNLLLQGYTRRDRQALLGWQRLMDRRKREQVARGQGSERIQAALEGFDPMLHVEELIGPIEADAQHEARANHQHGAHHDDAARGADYLGHVVPEVHQ